jgi:hypothetical protein
MRGEPMVEGRAWAGESSCWVAHGQLPGPTLSPMPCSTDNAASWPFRKAEPHDVGSAFRADGSACSRAPCSSLLIAFSASRGRSMICPAPPETAIQAPIGPGAARRWRRTGQQIGKAEPDGVDLDKDARVARRLRNVAQLDRVRPSKPSVPAVRA